MSKESIKKYGIFVLALVMLVAVDQWTKQYAQQRLATDSPNVRNYIQLEVDAERAGMDLREFLQDEFSANSEEEIDQMVAPSTFDADGQPMAADQKLEEGDRLEVRHREVVVIEDFWDYQYTINPGAAFGLLADADESFRKPFFIIVSLLAVGIIIGLLRQIPLRQQILFWGLTLIAAGALGNFIDRVSYGYVIDFIVWKYTDEYRWPTFNVADALICVGVALMIVEIIRDGWRNHEEGDGEEAEPATT